MEFLTDRLNEEFENKAEALKYRILNAKDVYSFSGKAYYVSNDGNDENDGSAERPWKTLQRVSSAKLNEGDAVLFKRGDIFRGRIFCKNGVTYAAYGEGDKPKIYGWIKDLADGNLWECTDAEHNIYHLKEKIPDCGTLVFNGGEAHSRKLIPSYINGKFVCRENTDKDFVTAEEMTNDLDLFCSCTAVMTQRPSHDRTFPIPRMCPENLGDLYLKCDGGNPGNVFASIEALPGGHAVVVGACSNVTIDNLCIKYCGSHAIGAGGSRVTGLTVKNCEIGWIGGTIQHYFGTDPNYVKDGRGCVTRYGNGIEIYGGCRDYLCINNYIYQVYDAGITHQFTANGTDSCYMTNVRYAENLIEYCVYSIEYFLSNTKGTDSLMDGLEIDGNILRYAGYGWGQQRHNFMTPAHIKSWTFENPAKNYKIHDNIFDSCRYRLLHLCGEYEKDLPEMNGNTYIQEYGLSLGQFGADSESIPPVVSFMENADYEISDNFGDKNAKVYYKK